MPIDVSKLIVPQPARKFVFGPDLVLHERHEVIEWPERVDTSVVKEEGLETLLLLNLDTLWPGYAFRLTRKTHNEWAGADIEAEDARRCRHVFEVKYGASVGRVVDQVLAYALSVLGGSSTEYFSEQDREEQELFLGVRIAGFWAHERTDKIGRDNELAPNERQNRVLTELAAKLNSEDLSEARIRGYALAARERLSAKQLPKSGDGRPHHLMFHVVVPSVERVNEEQLIALARLRYRGVQTSLWETSVELHHERKAGTLLLREVWLRPVSPQDGKPVEDCKPARTKIGALLASIHARDEELFQYKVRWVSTNRNAAICIANENSSADTPQLKIDLSDDTLRLVAGHSVTEYQRVCGWVRKSDPIVWAFARWLAKLAPSAAQAASAGDLVGIKKSKSWDTTTAAGLQLHVQHSGEGLTATISVDVAGHPFGELVDFTTAATSEFLRFVYGAKE
ncbi:MAG: hypothetical protein FWD69_10325 [Polyangiaceae bacterium]|nr:hypothetical protein [Polyangiaceae bacterium]